MRTFYKRNKVRCWISFLLISIIIIGNLIGVSVKYAKAAEDWVKINDSYNNGSQETEVDGDTIIQKGKHHSADDDVLRYETKYYRMTLDAYDLKEKFTDGKNAEIKYAYVPFTFGAEDTDGTTKFVEYIIYQDDFMSAAASKELGITGDYLHQHGSATVYLNNVFRVMKGAKELDSYVYGYQEMLGEADWSDVTVNYLKGYYNFKYVISDISFQVKVIAVDEDDKVLDNDLLDQEKRAIYNEVIPPYTLKDDTIVKDGVTYKYENWNYTYKDRKSEETRTLGNYPGYTVSFNAPDAYPGSTLTVKMVFKKQVPNYYYAIDAVDKNHNKLGDIISQSNKKETQYNKTEKYVIENAMSFKGKKYSYNNQWYLTYTNTEGKTITDSVQGGDITKKMPNAKAYSLAVFHVVYDTKPVTPTPSPKVTVTPMPEEPTEPPSPTPTPYIEPVIAPEPETKSLDFLPAFTTGQIRADNRGNELFTANLGVPSTESLFGQVSAKEYLLGYRFEKKVGIKYYKVKVTKNYILKYFSATPKNPKPVSDTVPVSRYVTVPRAYGYWEIENLEYYNIDKAVLYNYALPNGSLTLTPNKSYYNTPALNYFHSTEEDYHIIPPDEVEDEEGIFLPDETISVNSSYRPAIKQEDFTYEAIKRTGQIKVRSDSLTFNGNTVISDAVTEIEAPAVDVSKIPQCDSYTNENALYKNKQIIEATKKNGNYISSGTIAYQAQARIGSNKAPNLTYSIAGINDVVIHTPVICDPIITADNNKWSQLIKPDNNAVQIILDPDTSLNDFTVKISNTLHHSGISGYFTRDFSKSYIDPENVSYIAKMNDIVRNEMKLPFDVYLDTLSDGKQSNDKFIKAGTWIVMGRASAKFYVPLWVQEGTYTAHFRTIAVNGLDKLDNTEVTRNLSKNSYVATSTKTFQISGRMYGLTLYDISDYPKWEEVFRKKDTMLFKLFEGKADGTMIHTYDPDNAYYYTVGTNNQYGLGIGRYDKYTLPLINGSHPRFKNLGVIKTGYAVRFMLDTIGEMYGSGNHITITPTFYYVDAKGKNRQQVDLYYKEEINGKLQPIVKVGEGIDLVNIQSGSTGNIYSRIPEREIKNTAAVMNKAYAKISTQYSAMYSYSKLKLLPSFRTFIGTDYAALMTGLGSYTEVKKERKELTKTDLSKYIQRWYGTYKLPMHVHCVPTGYDVYGYLKKHGIDYRENFWLTGGYIIVNFNIVTIDKNGKEHLSYINANNYLKNGNCSMWVTEGASVQKTDNQGAVFNFKAGDFVIFYTDKKASDDYEGRLY